MSPSRAAARPRTRYAAVERWLPAFLHRHLLYFEAAIDEAVARFAAELPEGARVLDAGAGEGRHAGCFRLQRYVSVDLGVGDEGWNYGRLDCVADLAALPFPSGYFDGCLNMVTLEHVRQPELVLRELARVLARGGRLLMAVPLEWEVHQAPHDYYRYTRHGMAYLLTQAGFIDVRIIAAGGYFRLLSRRLLNGLQFFRGPWVVPAGLLLGPPALVLPLLDGLDRDRNFTMGYICSARLPSS